MSAFAAIQRKWQFKAAYENPLPVSNISTTQFQYNCVVARPSQNASQNAKAYLWLHCVDGGTECVADLVRGSDHIERVNVCADWEIAYGGPEGTILYGTVVTFDGHFAFIVDDIFFYRGAHVSFKTWGEKWTIYANLFTHYLGNFKAIHQIQGALAIGLPVCAKVMGELPPLTDIPYKVENYGFYRSHSTKAFFISSVAAAQPSPKVAGNSARQMPQQRSLRSLRQFWVQAVEDVDRNRPDMYRLYSDEKCATFEGMALIPNYTISIKMNQLLRNCGTFDLDSLEASDDEDVADAVEMKTRKMDFQWHPRFRKYYPIM